MSESTIINHGIRPRSILPGRERWDVPPLLKNAVLAQAIESQLSSQHQIIKVLANPQSGRVLVIYKPYQLSSSEIGELLEAAIPTSIEAVNNNTSIDSLSFRSLKENLAHRAQSNELYRLIQEAESDSTLRKKAVKLSMAHSTFKLISPLSIGMMVSSVLFPLQSLTNIGLTKGLQLTLFGVTFAISRIAESLTLHRKNLAWSRYCNEVESNLVQKTFDHVQRLNMSYLDQQTTDKLMNSIKTDSDIVKRFLAFVPQEITDKTTTIAIGSTAIFLISPVAFLLCMIPIPLITRLNKKQHQVTAGKYRQGAIYEGEFSQILSSNLNGLATVKSFTAEQQESQRIKQAKAKAINNTIEIDADNSYYGSLSEFSFIVGIVAPLIYGCVNVLKGGMAMPQFLAQNSLVPPLVTASTGLEQSRSLYNDAKMAAGRINDLLAHPLEWLGDQNTAKLENLHGELQFNNIAFGYREERVLNDISFNIAPKGKIAFVGPTGSGKSTLMKLLLRFYPLDQGSIQLDGIDISTIDLPQLRQSIGLVSQDPYLFNGSVYQNLCYGCPDATREQAIEACKVAQAYDFIMAHPDGLDAQIGERGNKLSGGQRQRLSIARAVLKNAAILILDEATSAVDNETEAAIRKSVELISQNTTVIIIAHRLSTISNVDTIYHLKNGKISEQGSHEQLLALNGDYASLWRLQTASGADNQAKKSLPVTMPLVGFATDNSAAPSPKTIAGRPIKNKSHELVGGAPAPVQPSSKAYDSIS